MSNVTGKEVVVAINRLIDDARDRGQKTLWDSINRVDVLRVSREGSLVTANQLDEIELSAATRILLNETIVRSMAGKPIVKVRRRGALYLEETGYASVEISAPIVIGEYRGSGFGLKAEVDDTERPVAILGLSTLIPEPGTDSHQGEILEALNDRLRNCPNQGEVCSDVLGMAKVAAMILGIVE